MKIGDGLCVGYDSGDAVSPEYKSLGTFKGGTISGVGICREDRPLRPGKRNGTNDEDAVATRFGSNGGYNTPAYHSI